MTMPSESDRELEELAARVRVQESAREEFRQYRSPADYSWCVLAGPIDHSCDEEEDLYEAGLARARLFISWWERDIPADPCLPQAREWLSAWPSKYEANRSRRWAP